MTPVDVIPTQVVGRGDYAAGFNAGVAAIRILAPGLTREQMLAHTRERVLPRGRQATDYDHGVSDAFAAWDRNWSIRTRPVSPAMQKILDRETTRRGIAATVPPFDPDYPPEP